MRFQEWLDSLPIGGVFVAFAVIGLIVYEIGFRIGRWWQGRTPEEQEGPTGMIVGSLFALMAFLLAITMGMASDRFDTRRGLVLSEANSMGTTYLRAGYLPEPASSQSQELLREYVPLRIAVNDDAVVVANLVRSAEIQVELWSIAEDLARTASSDVLALYIESLNETIDLNETRITGRPLRPGARDGPAPAHRGLRFDAGHGRLWRGPDRPAQPAHGHRHDRRPGRGHHPRGRPRPAA